jgi:hypothetical protein
MKKYILLFFAICLVIVFCITSFFLGSKQKTSSIATAPINKQETFSVSNGNVSFTIPIAWNAAVNGDSVYISKLDDIGSLKLAYYSVSPPDRPITLYGINWSQLDVYISTENFITEKLVSSMSSLPSSSAQVTEIPNQYFTIYAEKDLLPAGVQPSFDQPGGTYYYLKPKISNPTWNVVVVKRMLGDATFEADSEAIIKSFTFTPGP